MARRFRPDPPHVIARNMASAHLIRDRLYGGPTPWDGDGERDVYYPQMQRWAFIYRNFASQPPLFSVEEIWEAATRYAAQFGVQTERGVGPDEILRQRFRSFLREEAKRLGLHEKLKARPASDIPRRRKLVKEAIRKINVAERAEERKERARKACRDYYHRVVKHRYHNDPVYRRRKLDSVLAWEKRNREKARERQRAWHAKNPGAARRYARIAKLKKLVEKLAAQGAA